MSLIPWTRRDIIPTQFRTLRDELDEFFSPLLEQAPGYTARAFIPLVNVKEDDKYVTVTAELPGIDKKDVDIQVDGEVLTIRGERKEESAAEGNNWWRKESQYGAFVRRIALPCEVDATHTDASMRNGVLTIQMAKTTGTKAKSIKIL